MLSGDPHVAKGVDHANEQVLLLCVRKKLHIPLTAVVADHGKTGSVVFAAVVIQNLGEASVHLVGLSWPCNEPMAWLLCGATS